MKMHKLSSDQIQQEVVQLKPSPKDRGVLESIVLRLPDEQREVREFADVSPEGGLHGDRWGMVKSPNVRAQISVMNTRFLRVIAKSEERMSLAGDNLLVDFELNEENLPPGTRLGIGTAIFEVTDLPHTGCLKFERRYGTDALEFANAETHKSQRLRGLFIKVIQAGKIKVGDSINKIEH